MLLENVLGFLDDQLLTGVEQQHRDVYESERNVSYL